MDLGGLWRVAAGTEAERRTFHEFDHDDSGWATMPVPSHWAQGGGTAGSDLAAEESVLYRHRFNSPGDSDASRHPGSTRRPDSRTDTSHHPDMAADSHTDTAHHPRSTDRPDSRTDTSRHPDMAADPDDSDTSHHPRSTSRPDSHTDTARDPGSTDRPSRTDGSHDPAAAADWGDPGEPFATEETEAGRRWWLRLEGVAQQGDVWLDGAYLGHTDGYFVPHELEVTAHLAARREHLLAIEATCRRFGDPNDRSTLTGALQDPELCGSDDLIVGGVWRPVKLRSSGPVAILHARAVCTEIRMASGRGSRRSSGQARARLALRAVLDVPGGGAVQLRIRVAGTEHVHSHHAADGENRVEWTVEVDDPPLWWPHALGEQPLCDLTMDAIADDAVHDRRRFRIGFRSVEMRRWVLHVNGERMFVKGANVLPTSQLLGAASPSEVANDVRAARRAGLDMIRPLAHIARPELYDAADELGVLIWQDLPIRGVMSRSVASEARRQAREAVDLLGHHPSVAVWCAHDEPFPRNRRPSATPPAVSRLGPSWNRDVLDRRLARVLSRCDGSRPVVAHTGVPPHFPSLEGTTSHLWFGLHGGRAADLAPTLARLPTMGRFVSAFGTPVAADQPEVVKTTIEILRRLKYRPTGGFLLRALADSGTACDARSAAEPNRIAGDRSGEHTATGPGHYSGTNTAPTPGHGSGTGTAPAPEPNTDTTPGHGSNTSTTPAPEPNTSTTPGHGSNTGTAPDPEPNTSTTPGHGSGTNTAPTPGHGSGTGTAPAPEPNTATGPGHYSGTNTAPTPGHGSGTGTAPAPEPNTDTTPGHGSNTSTTPAPEPNTSTTPGHGSNTGTAPDPEPNTSTTPGHGSGTGTAPDPEPNTSTTPGHGSGTGTAPSPGSGSGFGELDGLRRPTTTPSQGGTRLGGGFGVLDGLRRPKPGWQALVDSCRPLIVVADPLPASVRAGDRLSLAVHVVNDGRQDVDGMQVRARLIGPDGALVSEQRWKGSAPADECAAVGRIDTTVPTGRPGTLTLELTLTLGGQAPDGTPHPPVAANRYTTTILQEPRRPNNRGVARTVTPAQGA